MKRQTTLAAAAVFGVAAWAMPITTANANITIDDFLTDQIATDTTNNGLSVTSSLLDANVLGGSREFEVNKLNPASALVGITDLSDSSQSLFLFDQGFTTGRGVGMITYDGTANNALSPMGLGGVDLTAGGTLANFAFINTDVSGDGLVLTVSLYDFTTGLPSTQTVTLIGGFSGNLLLPYTGFSSPVTAENVGAIRITIDGTQNAVADGSDVSFDLVASVPEPSGASLVACVAGSLLLKRRRRREELIAA